MRQRSFIALAVLIAVLVLGAVAVYAYDSSQKDKIANGVTAGGVDLSGLKPKAAQAKLDRRLAAPLRKTVVVKFNHHNYKLTPRQAQVRVNTADMVHQAELLRQILLADPQGLALSTRTPMLAAAAKDTRTRIRLLDSAGRLQADSHWQGPPEGSERPYFLMGDGKRPTDLWYWRNDSDRLDKAVLVQTTGSKSFQPGDNPGGLRAQGVFDNGQYRVVLQRTLRTKNAGQEIQFAVGQFLPFSITTWDGSNGERGGGKPDAERSGEARTRHHRGDRSRRTSTGCV